MSFWTAGNEPHRLPEGVGIRIPAQADIIIQVHYHPAARPAATEPRRPLLRPQADQAGPALEQRVELQLPIPAGNNNVEVKASWMIPVDVEAMAVSPHMHQLGHDMHMSVRLPNGRTQNLIEIADWDPSWQSAYYFQKPISLARRVSRQRRRALRQLRPLAKPQPASQSWSRSGPNFDDEMCVGYIALVKKGQDLTVARGPRRPVRDLLEATRTLDPQDGGQ